MNDELPFEEEVMPTSDDVRAYLEADKKQHEQEVIPELPSDVKKLLQEDAEENTEDKDKYEPAKLSPDKSFEENRRESFENMIVPVRDFDVPVTEDDKTLYIKSLLNSTAVELEIKAKNGTSGRCRALSVYEGDLAVLALGLYIKDYPGTDYMFQEGILQQFRIAMQLMSFCGSPLNYLQYERGKGGSKEEHAKDLYEKAQAITDVPGPVYGMYTRLLNVFQYKLNRLQEAAFNSDFWFPGDTD